MAAYGLVYSTGGRKFCDEYTGALDCMVDGELEGGFDDQLIDEAILGKKEGRERGETGRKRRSLDRMMKRKSVRARR